MPDHVETFTRLGTQLLGLQQQGSNRFNETHMGDYLMIILGTALVNNVVLVKFLGLCPFMGVSNKLDSALGVLLG
jgi:hypothetical protein